MGAKVKLGVVLPAHNTERYIKECIRSIKNQSFEDYIVIIIDDGSTDNTNKIVESIVKDDERFHLQKITNSGVGKARNIGLKFIKEKNTEYIYFCDSDDYLENNIFEASIKELDNSNADCVFFGIDRFTKEKTNIGAKKGSDFEKQILSHNGILTQYFKTERKWKHHSTADCFLNNKIFRLSKIKNEKFDVNLKRSGDFDFFLKIIPYLNKCVILPEIGYHYRLRKNSITEIHKRKGDAVACFNCLENGQGYDYQDFKEIYNWLVRAIYLDGIYFFSINKEIEYIVELQRFWKLKKNPLKLKYIRYYILFLLPISLQRMVYLRKFNKQMKSSSKKAEYYD